MVKKGLSSGNLFLLLSLVGTGTAILITMYSRPRPLAILQGFLLQSGIDEWQFVDPSISPSIVHAPTIALNIGVSWVNIGSADFIGHTELMVTRNAEPMVKLLALDNESAFVTIGNSVSVVFEPISLVSGDAWKLETVVHLQENGMGKILAQSELTIRVS